LQRSAQFLDSLLTSQPQPKEAPLLLDSARGKSSIRSIGSNSRFSDPPNPPPQAPLPEKPFDLPLGGLRRADTEKPKIPSPSHGSMKLDSSTASQFASLSEALNQAKKEAEEQRKKLTDMEKLLVEERVRRQSAEARAKQLEKEHGDSRLLTNGSIFNHDGKEEEQSTTPIEEEANSQIGKKNAIVDETTTAKLQKRLDLLLVELEESKQSALRFKTEKEEVIKQRDDERTEKSTLMELVDKYRKEERERQERKEKRNKRKQEGKSSSTEPEDDDAEDVEDEVVSSSHSGSHSGFYANGTLSSSLIKGKDGGTSTGQSTQLLRATPYISAFSVVLLGVAIMHLVNKMSRNEQ
jgi:chromosome segregation ATPase